MYTETGLLDTPIHKDALHSNKVTATFIHLDRLDTGSFMMLHSITSPNSSKNSLNVSEK